VVALVLRPAATAIDWEIIKGETFDIVVPVLDATEAPATVTGWTVKAQVRRSEDDPVLHEWSAAQSNVSVGTITVTLNVLGAATSLWDWTSAAISIEVYEPGGKPHVIASGTIRALPEITQ
jgi:hypothetical protein